MTEDELRELILIDNKKFNQEMSLHFERYSKDFIREIREIFPLDLYFNKRFLTLNITYKLQVRGKEDYFERRFKYFKEFWKELM